MDDSHLVLVFERRVEAWPASVTVGFENTADSSHSEYLQFDGTQRAHTRGTEDLHATRQRPEDLAMPHRRCLLELAVQQADCGGAPIAHGAIDIALPRGRKIIGVQQFSSGPHGHRRAQEYDGLHDAAIARAPGVYSPPGGVHGPSKP